LHIIKLVDGAPLVEKDQGKEAEVTDERVIHVGDWRAGIAVF